jgi:hypothetical protein
MIRRKKRKEYLAWKRVPAGARVLGQGDEKGER